MKSTFLLLIILFSGLLSFAQELQTVYSIAKVNKSHNWYTEQAGLWKKETVKNPKNEDAWYNYFKACRMSKMTFTKPTDWSSDKWNQGKEFLMEGDQILQLMEKHIPNTFTSNYSIWYNEGANPENFAHLQKAYELDPNRPEVYDGFVVYYETQGNKKMRKEFNSKWYKLNDLSPGLLQYNYNVLTSLKPGSILLTGGDNDTFPAWMIQDVLKKFEDIEVINIPLLNIDKYREEKFKKMGITKLKADFSEGSTIINNKVILQHIINNKPKDIDLYVSMAIWKDYYKEFQNNMYVVGNVLMYSESKIDNLSLITENFDKNYMLDYIKLSPSYDMSQNLVNILNVNYLPGIMQIYNYMKNTGNAEGVKKWKELGLLIGRNAGQHWEDKTKETFL